MYFVRKVAIDNVHIYEHIHLTILKSSRHLCGSTDQWHIDRSPQIELKFVLMHDTNKNHGPMEFYLSIRG